MRLHHTSFILNSSNVTVKMFMMNDLRDMEEMTGSEYYGDKEDCILT